MASAIRQSSFLLAPVLLVFALAQGQVERSCNSALSTAPPSAALQSSSSVVPQSSLSGVLQSSLSGVPQSSLNGVPQSSLNVVPQSSSSGDKPTELNSSELPNTQQSSSDLSAPTENNSSPAEQSASADENSVTQNQIEDEESIVTFFALMKQERYDEADDTLKQIEATARASGVNERIEVAHRLRQNLDALRK